MSDLNGGADQDFSSQSDLINELQILNKIGLILNRSLDVRTALNDALIHIVDLMGLKTGWIFLVDPAASDKWWGRDYTLAAHYNLPPAMALNNPVAWEGGCDCQGFCNTGKLTEAYNEVRCSRLADLEIGRRGLRIHASTPLQSGERTLGILNVAAASWSNFSPKSLALLSNAGSQIGAALERAYLYDMLKERRIDEQAALLNLSYQLLSRPDLDELIQYLVEKVRDLVSADAVAIALLENDSQFLSVRAAIGWHSDPVSNGLRLPVDQISPSSRAIRSQKPLLVNLEGPLPANLESAQKWIRAEGFVSGAIVPLVTEEGGVGLLGVIKRNRHEFDADEVRFLQLMANQAALAIENARLHQQEIEQQRLEQELAVGRDIQLSLLPKSCPTPPGWEFCDIYRAARQVGGDFYDFFELPGKGNKLGLVIGDVSDKGVPAALFMGVSRTIIRNTALSDLTPSKTLERANQLIQKESQAGLFLSVFYGVLDLEDGRFTYANAGHNPPLFYSARSAEMHDLTADGIVLCVLDDIVLEEKQICLNQDDLLIFYTDGVTEAMNGVNDEFSLDRLRTVVQNNASTNAAEILNQVIKMVDDFAEGVDQSDDLTLFVVKRK